MLQENVVFRLYAAKQAVPGQQAAVIWTAYGLNTPFEVQANSLRVAKAQTRKKLAELFFLTPEEQNTIEIIELQEHLVAEQPDVWIRTLQDANPDTMLWRRTIREEILTPPPNMDVFSHGHVANGAADTIAAQICLPTDSLEQVTNQVGSTGLLYLTEGVHWRALATEEGLQAANKPSSNYRHLRELGLQDDAEVGDLFAASSEGELFIVPAL